MNDHSRIQIRPNDQIAKCKGCGSRNIVMHQDLRIGHWAHWFHCNACGQDTPHRELRDDAVEDVLWVSFLREVQAP